jgi:hypothetical protein
MDEDMSAAMQYLQSKGLCLMPISLATAISSNPATGTSTAIARQQQQASPALSIADASDFDGNANGNEKLAIGMQAIGLIAGHAISTTSNTVPNPALDHDKS